MTWTPETLAEAFHDAYGRVSPAFFGVANANPPAWDSIPEKSRQHLIAVCADVLGTPFEVERIEGEPVPTREEFAEAKASVPEEGDNASGDWEDDLRRQIDGAVKRARYAKPGFDGIVR
jgi:hypothetical protein